MDEKAALDHVPRRCCGTPSRVIGIGSPRASLEANFACAPWLARSDSIAACRTHECRLIDAAIGMLRCGCARAPSLDDVEQSDAVLVLGEDVTNTAPMLALALRQSTLRREIDLTQAAAHPLVGRRGGARGVAAAARAAVYCHASRHEAGRRGHDTCIGRAPDDLVRLRFGRRLCTRRRRAACHGSVGRSAALVDTIAEDLYHAQRPLVVSGTGCGSEAVMRAAANIAWALCAAGRHTQLCFTVPECNSLGLGLLGGRSLADACRDRSRKARPIRSSCWKTICFGGRTPDWSSRCWRDAKHVIAIDHFEHATTAAADVVLPAATFAEADGTLVNYEGRAQRFFRVFVPQGDVQESWRWLRDMMTATGRAEAEAWTNLDQIICGLAETMPVFQSIREVAPRADFRIAGQKIPRQPHRYSGRTAMHAEVTFTNRGRPMIPIRRCPFPWRDTRGSRRRRWWRGVGPRLELGAVADQVSGRGGRAAPGRRFWPAADRAEPKWPAGLLRRSSRRRS